MPTSVLKERSKKFVRIPGRPRRGAPERRALAKKAVEASPKHGEIVPRVASQPATPFRLCDVRGMLPPVPNTSHAYPRGRLADDDRSSRSSWRPFGAFAASDDVEEEIAVNVTFLWSDHRGFMLRMPMGTFSTRLRFSMHTRA